MRTVLLIDDDAVVRELLAGYLREHGWRVLEAQDGETGLEMAKVHRPAAILSDLMMPRLNGFQLCAAVRAEPALSRMRIVAISGRTYPADRQSALDAGADEFLLKPVNGREVLEILDRLVGPETAGPAAEPEPSLLKAAPALARFWGVRGSIPTPGPQTVVHGGNTACVEVRADGEIIILDSGTGIRPLGLALASEFKGRPLRLTILISHTHWDHIQGFPFFVPAYDPKNQIRILGYEGARAGLAGIFSNQMEGPYFPIGLNQLPSHLVIEELRDLEFAIGKVKVQAAFMNHPGVCVGYRLQTSQGSVAYLPDNEPCLRLRASADAAVRQRTSLDFAQAEDQKIVDFLQNTDVLIADAQYDAQEYQAHIGWGHGCVDDVVALALRARIKRLYLFHHDPSHDDAKLTRMTEHARKLAAARGGQLEVQAAKEGTEVELRGDTQCAKRKT